MKKLTPMMLSFVITLMTTSVMLPAQAEVVIVGGKMRVLVSKKTPRPGMSMRQVRKRYGKPLKKKRSTGRVTRKNPRITIWHYPNYRVYFEKSRVLHSVIFFNYDKKEEKEAEKE